jgi:hypothetical protein
MTILLIKSLVVYIYDLMACEFEELAHDEHNYSTWARDIKITLAFRGILPALSLMRIEKRHFWIHTSTKHYSSSRITSTRPKFGISDGEGTS